MKRCLRVVLIVCQIGGGFSGISVLLSSREWNASVPLSVWVLSSLFAILFLSGIIAGLWAAEGKRHWAVLSAVYQGLQIPVVSCPAITFGFYSGIELRLGWWRNEPVLVTGVGARCVLSLFHSDPWGIGINVLALVLFMYVILELRSQRGLLH